MKFGMWWLVLIFYHVRDNFAIGLYGLVGFIIGWAYEFGITTSMFRLRGCSKSVVEVLAVVWGVVLGEARSENILKKFPLAIDKKNDFTSIDAL